jgi:hypothetical protein
MSDTVDIDLLKLRQGMDALYQAVESIATREPAQPTLAERSLTGNHIMGGKISQFQSVGIKDDATKSVVLVNDKGVHTDNLNVKNLLGDTNVTGNLDVKGDITARKLHVDELTADVRLERSTPLEFAPDANGIYGKGIIWRAEGGARSLVYRANPDRIWSSDPIDLTNEAYYAIDGIAVLRLNELGNSVRNSNLVTVGTLQNLKTTGDLVVDEYMYYESASERLGLGTESPNGALSIASLGGELILDVEDKARVGTWTTTDLELVTDDTARITVSATGNVNVHGKLGIGVKNPDADIVTAGPVKFQGKKQEVGSNSPREGAYKIGDIVWNDNPQPTGYVGWICVRTGTPGEWKPFGQIGK